MAKAVIDPIVSQFLAVKPVISKIKQLGQLVMFEQVQGRTIGYVISESPWDQFVILDEDIICTDLCNHLIVPDTFIGFAKDVRKTKTKATFKGSDIELSNPGEDEKLLLCHCEDSRLVTHDYNCFMKEPKLSKTAIDMALKDENPDRTVRETYWASAHQIAQLAAGESLMLPCDNDIMVVSRAIFGQMKKTQYLGWEMVDSDDDSFVALFNQKEDGCYVYTLARFLKANSNQV